MVVRLQLRVVTVVLTMVASSFPLPLLASSSYHNATASSTAAPPSFADGRLLRAGRRANRTALTPEPHRRYGKANARRISAQYGCRWSPDVCAAEPLRSVLGPDCCRSVCTNVKKDVLNCGLCGHICFYGSICCNGACIDIFNNHRHCGGCHNTCPVGASCQYGMCDYT